MSGCFLVCVCRHKMRKFISRKFSEKIQNQLAFFFLNENAFAVGQITEQNLIRQRLFDIFVNRRTPTVLKFLQIIFHFVKRRFRQNQTEIIIGSEQNNKRFCRAENFFNF